MNSRTATLLWASVALTAASLGITAFGAASFGHHAFRAVGLSLLGLGGATAAVLRSNRARRELDQLAVAEVERARVLLEEGSHAQAANAASRAAKSARTSRTRNAAHTTLAWAALGQGYAARARAALDRIQPPHALDLYCFAAVESANGRPEVATKALELARSAHGLSCEGAKLLVDLYARENRIDSAVRAAMQSREVLGAANCRLVVKAACEAGACEAATALAAALFEATCAPEDAAALRAALAHADEMGRLSRTAHGKADGARASSPGPIWRSTM